MAPFDPLQLLKLLSPLLSLEGGIKSPDEVPRLSSLMKKFSKKLVSRCVYCNVLKATKQDVLNAFLDLEGWMTINTWLVDAKDNKNDAFLEELLSLCKELPMTVNRLKQNNTAKLVKTLTKYENSSIRKVSIKLVESWMKLIKGATPLTTNSDKSNVEKVRKKPKKEAEDGSSGKPHVKEEKEKVTSPVRLSPPKAPVYEYQDDVEYEPEPRIVEKVTHKDRPKIVKTLQTKFRSTGLIEEAMLPKSVTKKPVIPVVDRDVIAAATKKRLSTATVPPFPEKKVKPASLITPASETNGPGIKLILPKPRPAHILHESAGFMDALDAAPVQPLRKKKVRKTPASPTTPPATAPKLQFYKDTLEMGEGKAKVEEPTPEVANVEVKKSPERKSPERKTTPEPPAAEEPAPAGPVLRRSLRGKKKLEDEQKKLEEEQKRLEEEEKKKMMEEDDEATETEEDFKEEPEGDGDDSEATQEGDEVPMDVDDKGSTATAANIQEVEEVESESEPKKVKSILMLTRRRERKKSVRWVEDDNLKQFFYFEMDENERENVSNARNFGDLKSLEMKRERMAFETARRRISDNMSEAMAWRSLRRIDLPPPLVDPGCNSKEKELQMHKQKTTLEEIYFSREMLPETPHEPDPDPLGPAPQEPVLIPGEDLTNPGVVMDYSTMELPPPNNTLPPVLTSLMMSIAPPFGSSEEEFTHMNRMNESGMGAPPVQMPFVDDLPTIQQQQQHIHQEQFQPMMMPQPPQQQPPQQMHPQQHMQGQQMMGQKNMQMWATGGNQSAPHNWSGPPIDSQMGMFEGPGDDMMGCGGGGGGGGGGPNKMGYGGPPQHQQQDMFQGHQQQQQQQGMRPPIRGNGPYMMGGGGGAGGGGGSNGGGRHQRQSRGQNRGNMWRPPHVLCKHFVTGTCRFGANCNFLHPGVNGPAM